MINKHQTARAVDLMPDQLQEAINLLEQGIEWIEAYGISKKQLPHILIKKAEKLLEAALIERELKK